MERACAGGDALAEEVNYVNACLASGRRVRADSYGGRLKIGKPLRVPDNRGRGV